jgi:hypothetical protein
MQLLKLVIFNVSIEIGTTHGIRIVLVGDGAVFPSTGVPGWYDTFAHYASVVGHRAVIVCMISGKTPVANLPQGTIILIVIG